MLTKFNSLQVFRGVAALLVLLFHATLFSELYLHNDLLNGAFLFGYSGVDFFFVLSGFIIFWTHRKDLGQRKPLKSYARKRFVRIYPMYWIVALALVPLYFGIPHRFGDYLVLLKSFLLLPQANNPVMIVAWSLTFEVFFYALIGLAIYLPWNRMRLVLAVWLVITAAFFFAKLLGRNTFQMPPHTGFVFSAYNLEFGMGCLAAEMAARSRFQSGRLLMVAGLCLFVFSAVCDRFMLANVGRLYSIPAYGVASTLLIWGAVLWEQRSARMLPAFLLLLGDASYSIYLTHDALLDGFVRGSLASGVVAWVGPKLVTLLAIVVALSVGVLIHLIVEKPLLAWLRKQSTRRVELSRSAQSPADPLSEGTYP